MKKNLVIAISFIMFFCISDFSFAKNNKEKDLPPGLQKKVEHGKSLPPGWQRKLVVGDILNSDIYEQGEIIGDENGLLTIRVEGTLIRIIKNTRKIIQFADGI